MKRPKWTRLGWIVLALALCVTAFAPSLAEPRRIAARINEPFEIGDGVYPPGHVTIRTLRDDHPTAVLCEIHVGRACVGLFRATRVAPPPAATLDSLSFGRSTGGRLVLEGFAVGRAADRRAYRLEPLPADGATRVARR